MVAPLLHINAYGEVPPETVVLILPFELPQYAAVVISDEDIKEGCVIETETVFVQLLLSVTVKE